MQILVDTLARVHLGSESAFRTLTMFPLLGEAIGKPRYLTLDEALARGCVRITEVSKEGHVPELAIENSSDTPVLLLDGEELVGAKQNRVLNVTVLAPAQKRTVIPVSCVEAGRWSHASPDFAASENLQFAECRASRMESVSALLRECGARYADQSRVWADIGEKAQRMGVHSPTGAMSEIFHRYKTSVEDYVKTLGAVDGQIGGLFAIGERIIGMDLFDHPETLTKLLAKVVRSYALDALEVQEAEPRRADRLAAEGLLRMIANTDCKTYPAVGEGTDVRGSGDGVIVGALLADKQVIHLAAFTTNSDHTVKESGFSRASARSRHYR